MDEKRFIEIIENNNEKLVKLMDEKIMTNNKRITDLMEMNNEALMLNINNRFEKVEKGIKEVREEIKEVKDELKREIKEVKDELKREIKEVKDDRIYFEETYSQKNKILLQRIESNEELQSIERKALDNYKQNQDVRFNSQDVRITNLEEVVNA